MFDSVPIYDSLHRMHMYSILCVYTPCNFPKYSPHTLHILPINWTSSSYSCTSSAHVGLLLHHVAPRLQAGRREPSGVDHPMHLPKDAQRESYEKSGNGLRRASWPSNRRTLKHVVANCNPKDLLHHSNIIEYQIISNNYEMNWPEFKKGKEPHRTTNHDILTFRRPISSSLGVHCCFSKLEYIWHAGCICRDVGFHAVPRFPQDVLIALYRMGRTLQGFINSAASCCMVYGLW